MGALQQIIRHGFSRLTAARAHIAPHRRRALERISICRTSALGGHIQECPDGHMEKVWYNSCRERSCPECNFTSVERWLDKQKARLINCDYYHIIFTIPHELIPLWLVNVAAFNNLICHAIRDTLFQLLHDPKHLGGEPGLIIGLHTWGQTVNVHPHGHCLVTGGGMTPVGDWRAITNGYLLPGRVVRDLFRGKLCDMLRQETEKEHLIMPEGVRQQQILNLLNKLGRKKWNVCIRERYAHGRGVVTYLGRYLRGGPISNKRIVAWDDNTVKFRFKDYKAAEDGGKKHQEMELPVDDFLQRLMRHVPEPRRNMVRSYGLYAGRRRQDLDRCREQVGQEPVPKVPDRDWQEILAKFDDNNYGRCPVCGARLVLRSLIKPEFKGRATKFPLTEAA